MVTATKTCPQCGGRYDAEQRFCALDGAALRGATAGGTLVGEVLAERYLVRERLGEGGMGEVYRAEHVRMGRPCAVKVLRAAVAADPDAVSRFNREAANASRVAHPNVAAVYDFGETADGLIYLAMELVEGRPLRGLLEDAGALPPARALDIAAQIAAALDAAHALGIVHRDLKPDNVMLGTTSDDGDLVKVVDFGIAKAGGGGAQQVTRTGLIVGTPEYMSPEQLAGDAVDARSDVYALALLTYAMLTGAHPFPAETVQDTLVLRLTTPPRRLADARPDVPWPAAVQTVLDRGLARRADDRYARAGDLARDLAAAYGGATNLAITPVHDAPTQVLAATAFSLPATRVAPARPRAAVRRPSPALAAVAVLVVGTTLGVAGWRGRATEVDAAPAPVGPVTSAPSPAPPADGPTPLTPVFAAHDADAAPEAPAPRDAALEVRARDTARNASRDAPAPASVTTAVDDDSVTETDAGAAIDVRLAAVEQLVQEEQPGDAALAAALLDTQRAQRETIPASTRWYRARVYGALVVYMLRDGRVDAEWYATARAVPAAVLPAAVPNNTLRTTFELLRTACDTAACSEVSRP